MNDIHARLYGYFDFNHLPEHLQEVSAPFRQHAEMLIERVDAHGADPAETTVALRKLLEAKDCAVRACL